MTITQSDEKPLFYTAKTVVQKDRKDIVSIPTGVMEIDKRIIGLNKKEISLFSGLNGSGKSSVLSQISLSVVDIGRKVALFSGELNEGRVLEWIQLQAAGKQNSRPSSYENYYYVPSEIKKAINEWLDQKMFIYNNVHGNDQETILEAVSDCINRKKVDIVILDNLMSIDLGETRFGDKNNKQSQFIRKIKSFSETSDVHTVLVAHPRKTIGFLRKTDIAGTADLTNMADNVFIVHRVNEDFKRLSKEVFGARAQMFFGYSNVIEICKNRDLGVMDYFAGLYYEKESKRFKNTEDENRIYGWEKNLSIDTSEEFVSPFDL